MRQLSSVAVGVAMAAVMVLSSGAVAKPTRSGKVVRVERPRSSTRTTLRICQMENVQVGQGTCYGGMPSVDDEAEVYDATGYQGHIRITEAKTMPGDLCAGDSGGEVYFDYIEGKGVVNYSVQRLMVFGGGTSRDTSKALDAYSVKSPSSEQPFMVIDRNGDGVEDLMSTVYECPAIAPPNPFQQTATGSYNSVWCVDYWRRDTSEWEKLRQDFYYSCR